MIDSQTAVSVIIPTYNRLWCLPRAVESCRNTTCKTQIIVVDDGSTDGTLEWLQTQDDVEYIKQKNQGQTYAINNGVSIARGTYIRFLDSDDFLKEGIIDLQYQKAIETSAELVYSRVDVYFEATGKTEIKPEVDDWKDFLEVQLSNRYGSHFLGMLFHRHLIESVPRRPDYAFREDRMFLLEVGLLNPKTAYVDGCGGYWVQHSEQMQANYSGLKSQVTNWQHLQIFKRILKELEEKDDLTIARIKAASTVLWILAHWIGKAHLKEASEIVNWIYKLDPNFAIPEKGLLGFLYKRLGFSKTQKLLKIRRFIKHGWD